MTQAISKKNPKRAAPGAQANTIPYDQMRAALYAQGAKCIAVCRGPNSAQSGAPRSTWSDLEFWCVGNNEKARLVILQRWIEAGGFDMFLQERSHLTAVSIAEIDGTADAARLRLIQRAEGFIAGFEDDADQEGVPALLADLRAAIGINTPPLKESANIVPSSYAMLHDGLSDMIEGGRLREEHIPDDYRWLVESLAKLAKAQPVNYDEILALFSESLNSWEGEEDSVQEEHADLIERMNAAWDAATKGKPVPTPEAKPLDDARTLATVLAALRFWQREGLMSAGHEQDIATSGDELDALTAEEIDNLCEELNCA